MKPLNEVTKSLLAQIFITHRIHKKKLFNFIFFTVFLYTYEKMKSSKFSLI